MNKKVSVIVRTHDRPQVLREAMASIAAQTYDNIEVVVVEDGQPSAKKMLETEFGHMNIVYEASGIKAGRCKVANMGLSMASGEYVCFLDDDDLFYENHVAVLAGALDKSSCRVVYGIAEESQIKIRSYDPYVYKEVKRHVEFARPFNKLLLYHKNFMPIQTVMFERSLFAELGGMDPQLDLLEDWDMWVRYSTVTDFEFVPAVTSLYRVPTGGQKKERELDLDAAYAGVVEKYKQYHMDLDVNRLSRDLSDLLKNGYDNRSVGPLRKKYRRLKAVLKRIWTSI